MDDTLHRLWRLIIMVVGVTVLIFGIALLILPGPGWLTIFLALFILGSEFIWARRLLKKSKAELKKAKTFLKNNIA